MSLIKKPQEIEKLKKGGVILSAILRELKAKCVAGAKTAELDALAQQRMAEQGGKPSFLGYAPDPEVAPFPGAATGIGGAIRDLERCVFPSMRRWCMACQYLLER